MKISIQIVQTIGSIYNLLTFMLNSSCLRSIKLVEQYVYFVKNLCNCSLSYLNQIEFLASVT